MQRLVSDYSGPWIPATPKALQVHRWPSWDGEAFILEDVEMDEGGVGV